MIKFDEQFSQSGEGAVYRSIKEHTSLDTEKASLVKAWSLEQGK